MARLVVNPGSSAAWEIQLKRGENSIGRGFSNDFQIPDPSVSGSHCRITVNQGSAVIKDLESTNGTFVDRSPVQETVLRSGQIVRLGNVEMVFSSDVVEAVTGSQPAPVVRRVGVPVRATAAPVASASSTSRLPPTPRLPPKVDRFAARGPQRPQPIPGFFRVVWTAFGYPFQGDGVVLLVTGTVFFSILNAAKFFAAFAGLFGLAAVLILTVIGTGYLTCYLRRIVTGTAMGESRMPDWPDVSDLGSDIIAPFLQLLGTLLASFLPAIAVAILVDSESASGEWLLLAAVAWGAVYFPMAFLAVAMLDTIVAVNPLLVVPSIIRVPLPYVFICILFGAAFALRLGGQAFLSAFLPVRFLAAIAMAFVELYFLTVAMRVLGFLYWTSQHRLGWVSR